MHFLRARERPAEIIAVMALFSALDAALALLSAFFPAATAFLMLVVPLSSAFIAMTCPLKALPLFVLSAFGTSLAVSFFDFQTLLFYLLPALIIGAAYGLFERLRVPSIYHLFLEAILAMALFLLTLLLGKGIYGISFYDLFLQTASPEKQAYMSHVFLLFCYSYSLAQTLLTHLFTRLVFSKMKRQEPLDRLKPFWPYLFASVSLIGIIGCSFVSAGFAYLFLGFFFYWVLVTCVKEMPTQPKWMLAPEIASIFISILIFAAFFSAIPEDKGLLLTGVPFAFFLAINAINGALRVKRARHKINEP